MNTHTPGPWTAECNEEMPNGFIFAPGSETLIAEMTSNGQGAHEVMANARLIAAAPELLEAVKMAALLGDATAYANDPTIGCLVKVARAALAKVS